MQNKFEEYSAIKNLKDEDLLTKYAGFLTSLCNKYDTYTREYFDDMIQSARLELLKCQKKYDPLKNVNFITYSRPYVLDAIRYQRQLLKAPITIPESSNRRHVKQEKTIKFLYESDGSDKSNEFINLKNDSCEILKLADRDHACYEVKRLIELVNTEITDPKKKEKMLNKINSCISNSKYIKTVYIYNDMKKEFRDLLNIT